MFLFLKKSEILRLINRFRSNESKCRKISVFLHSQVMERFRTGGASGGTPWAKPKWVKQVGADDGRAILTGPTGYLLKSWHGVADKTSATVASDAPYARLHQLGTKGKGGSLPDIVPRKGKALFIPLTARAQNSVRLTGSAAAWVKRSAYGAATTTSGPIRAAVVLRKVPGTKMRAQTFSALIRGRIKDGKLQKFDPTYGWVDGIPDFIFLRRVSIPKRPMFPDSPQEQAAQTAFVTDLMGGK